MMLSGRPLLATKSDSELFVGRAEVLERIAKAVALRFNVLLLGERGSGKTSTVHQLVFGLRQLNRPCQVVSVDGSMATDARSLLEVVHWAWHESPMQVEWEGPAWIRNLESMAGGSRSAPSQTELILEALGILRARANEEPELVVVDAEPNDESAPELSQVEHPWTVIVLDGVPPAKVLHTLFGSFRDELWQIPASWIVVGDPVERATYLAPPADTFFESIVTMPAISRSECLSLLRARVAPEEADDGTLAFIADYGHATPRQVLERARFVLLEDKSLSPSRDAAEAERIRRLAELGRPATMLAAELKANGPASASDERLQRRLGWTRSRLVQVLGQLQDAGLVSASELRGGPGRPRKVYELVDEGGLQ